MTYDQYFDAERFRSALGDFVFEVWENANQAASESGIASQDLYEALSENKKLLRPWQINALLTGALYEKRLTKERHDYWYRALHRELIFVKTLSAWLYSETDKRIRDPVLIEEAIEHNRTLKENFAKEFPFLETVVDTVFKAGGSTWSFATLYFIIRKTKRSKDAAKIILPGDWLIYFLDLSDPLVAFELPTWDEITAELIDRIDYLMHKAPVLIWRAIINIIKRWGQ